MAGPYTTALADHARGTRTEPLLVRDGEQTREHPIEVCYFGQVDPADDRTAFLERHLRGPLIDLGAGVGRDSLYFQERFETLALEAPAPLVDVMRERGVEDAVTGDMFDLTSQFEADRFRSALSWGTQLGLAKSMAGLRAFFESLATVTAHEATAVVDSYDPTHPEAEDLLGYRADESTGMAFRVMQFEYEGNLGDPLVFRLVSPDRLLAAAEGAGWEGRRSSGTDGPHYVVALEKAE